MVNIRFRSRSSSAQGTPTVAGRLFASAFFLLFFLMGALFVVFIVREVAAAAVQYGWHRTPCRITSSDISEQQRGHTYRASIHYSYEFRGRTYTGDVYKRGYNGSDTYTEAQEIAARYPAQQPAACFVNPRNASEAVLERPNLLIGVFVLIPLVFVVVGAGGLYVTWRSPPAETPQPVAPTAARQELKGGAGAAFFAIFALVGAGMLYPLTIRPIARTLSAESWVETPCRVLHAEVRSHDSDDGTTYSVYVLYEYEFDGRTYKSDRYSFVGGSSSGYRSKKRKVEMYRSAERPVCYVNPENPSEAVLKRGFHLALLLTLFPLPFLLVGVFGAVHCLRRKLAGPGIAGGLPRASDSRGTSSRSRSLGKATIGRRADPGAAPEFVVYSARSQILKRIAGTTIFALFWNGVLSFFVYHVIDELRHGHVDWFLMLFLIPFLLVGLVALAYAVHQCLALLNPLPALRLKPGRVALGGTALLQWRCSGNVSRISEFTVTLSCREEARYQQGTSTSTDKNTFFEFELVRATSPEEIRAGRTSFAVPDYLMHSFDAPNNKIIWTLEMHAQIPNWPDVKASFPVEVTPLQTGEESPLP